MSLQPNIPSEGVEIVLTVTPLEYKMIKYGLNSGYDTNINNQFATDGSIGSAEEFIRKLLYWEILALELHSGEVEKFRWKLLMAGKNPDIDLRDSNPELFVKSGGIIRDKRIPQYKPKFPALMHVG